MRLAFGDFDMSPSVAAPLLMATMAKCDRRHLHAKYPQKRARRAEGARPSRDPPKKFIKMVALQTHAVSGPMMSP